jgi:hypothetical protein
MPNVCDDTVTLETVVCEGQKTFFASSSKQPADARLSESPEERKVRFHAFLTAYRAQYQAAEEAWKLIEDAPSSETPEGKKRRHDLSLLPIFV